MSQRGFTLLELLVASAIAVIIGFFCLRAATAAMHTLTMTQSRFNDAQTLARLSDLWRIDEDQAWAIFTPPNDVNGTPNTDGHEVDFYLRDAKQRPQFWSYTFNAPAKTVTRYIYSSPGATPTIDETFTGITSFLAHTYPVTALQDSTSPIYSPLYSGATLQAGAVQFYAATQPWIAGGNQITYVRLTTAQISRELHLSTATAPSGWIVVLNYTPAPTPTSASGLHVWPPAVRYGLNGTQLADAGPPRMTAALLLNNLIGGGVANAAGTCPAQAFTDPTFATAISRGTTDPYGGAESITGANGCYDGGIDLNEAGTTVLFQDNTPKTSACTNSEIAAGTWTNNHQGPSATQTFAGGSQAVTSCLLGFTDGTTTPTVAAAVFACAPIVSGPVDAQPYCIWTGWTASGGPTGVIGTTAESQVWYYDSASSSGPVMDCSDPSVGCTWDQAGSVAFCQQPIDPNTGTALGPATIIVNTDGFTCSSTYAASPPAKNWKVIPCQGPPLACKTESGGGPVRP